MDLQNTITTSTLLDDKIDLNQDYFIIENFFTPELIKKVWDELEATPGAEEFYDKEGVHKGNITARQTWIKPEKAGPRLSVVLKQVEMFLGEPVEYQEIDYVKLTLPWDVHSDHKKNETNKPYFNALIPLHDVESHTVLFNEKSPGYIDFWKYKRDHNKAEHPVPQDIWDKNCAHCWPEDREYLSLKAVLPAQRAGQLILFKRDLFHCSDCFHLRGIEPKYFIQLIINKK